MFTPDDIKTIVSRAFKREDVEVIDYNTKAHSLEKVGFLGDHQNLEITLRRKNNNNKQPEVHRFFVKAVPKVFADQSTFVRDHGIFEQESAFFNVMLPLLQSNFDSAKFCPKCYLANDDVIVLEDLRQRGFAMRNSKIFRGDHLKAAVRAQARLHAASVLAEARIGKSLKDICPRACSEVVFTEKQVKHKRVEMYVDLAEKVAKASGRDLSKLHAALQQGFADIQQPSSKLGLVVCHGDTWPNNSLFDASSPPNCVMVDFQLTRYAPRMYDVAQLVYLSTTRDIRKREEREVVEAYHEELCETLRMNNPALSRPSLKDLLDEYENVRLSALMASVMYYPIICLSSDELSKYADNEEEIYKKVMFRADNDYVVELCEREKGYGERILEVVHEVLDFCENSNLVDRIEKM